jgi:hypothetical protein
MLRAFVQGVGLVSMVAAATTLRGSPPQTITAKKKVPRALPAATRTSVLIQMNHVTGRAHFDNDSEMAWHSSTYF